MDYVPTANVKKDGLDVLVNDGGPFFECSVGLFTNEVEPGPNTVLADITPPAWTGYAATGALWGAAQLDGLGGAAVLSASLVFTSGANADTLVRGYYLFKGADLLLVQLLDAAEPIVGVRDIMIIPRLQWN